MSIVGLIVLGFYFYITSNNFPPRFSNIQSPQGSPCAPNIINEVNCLHNQTLETKKTNIGIASFSPEQKLREKQASDAFNKGLVLVQSGKIQEGLKYYDEALAIQPVNADLFVSKGDALSRIGNYSDAIKYYDSALAVSQTKGNSNPDILTHKANDLYRLGEYNQAIEYYNKALVLQPHDLDLLINKGNALFHIANYTDAIKYYDKALAVNTDNSSSTNNISSNKNSTISVIINKAAALFQLGNYSDAIKYYDKALTMAPSDVTVREGKMSAERALNKSTNNININTTTK